jgi:hypothetical protein
MSFMSTIIKRSGKRLQYFHIWYHQDSRCVTEYISERSIDAILNALKGIGPSLSLQRFVVSGSHSL